MFKSLRDHVLVTGDSPVCHSLAVSCGYNLVDRSIRDRLDLSLSVAPVQYATSSLPLKSECTLVIPNKAYNALYTRLHYVADKQHAVD